jgi:hypothetical protein
MSRLMCSDVMEHLSLFENLVAGGHVLLGLV